MKRFLLLLILFCLAFSVSAAKSKKTQRKSPSKNYDAPSGWCTTWEQAAAQSAKTGQPILVLISGPEWCGPCKALHEKVIENKEFKRFVRQNAVGLYIHCPNPVTEKAKAEMGKCEFFGGRGGVPRYAIVSKDKKILATPDARTVESFKQAILTGKKQLSAESSAPGEPERPVPTGAK